MKYILFILKSAFEDFRRNKVRTLLTSLGILIGVASVVLLIAFGLGLKKYIQNQFNSLGTNLLTVYPGQLLKGGSFQSSAGLGASIHFDSKDVTGLKRIKGIEFVIPVFTKSIPAVANNITDNTSLYAVSEEVFAARNLQIDQGRLFEKTDVEKHAKIVVIGPKLAEKLYEDAPSAIGKSLKIQSESFRIVGVLKAKGSGGFGGPDFDSYVYMPYKSAYGFNPDKTFAALLVKVQEGMDVEEAKKDITTILLKRYKVDDFSVIESTEILNAISSIFSILNIVLVAIAAISLVVGGIGIMNIMYVSVIERIREIGIRRAIGATRNDILFQFLIEAVILSLLGGTLGLLFSFLVVLAIQPIFPAYIDTQSVMIALGVSSFIGITFGVFPAKKAADLSPIDAIRYE